jgi:hypothetical protein
MPILKDNDARRGYTDRNGAARYFNVSVWQIDAWERAGILRPGVTITPRGKKFFRFVDLDAAFERAARSRRPRREPRGIIRQRLEAKHHKSGGNPGRGGGDGSHA